MQVLNYLLHVSVDKTQMTCSYLNRNGKRAEAPQPSISEESLIIHNLFYNMSRIKYVPVLMDQMISKYYFVLIIVGSSVSSFRA